MKKVLLTISMPVLIWVFTLFLFTAATAQTIQTFGSSGSWVCPAGVTSVTVETWGGGGAGGGLVSGSAAGSGAGGGGGGSYTKLVVTVVPGTSYPYIVGAGGTGTTGAGASGGSSSFNGAVTAAGGTGGGIGPSGAKGTGAAGSDYDGGDGSAGVSFLRSGAGGGGAGDTGSGGDASGAAAGAGGSGGGGTGGAGRTNTGAGNAGSALSAGGGGAFSVGTSTGRSGGSGAKGQVQLTYCPIATNTATITAASPTSLNWNSLAWSLGHPPTACENAVIVLDRTGATGSTTETFTISLVNFTVQNLTMKNVSNCAKQILFNTTASSALDLEVNGDLIVEAAGGTIANKYNRTVFGLGNSSKITVYGDIILGRDGTLTTATEGMASVSGNPSTWVMYGDMIFNPRGYTTNRGTVFTFNKPGTAYLTNNTRYITTDTSQAVLFETLNIGTTNQTKVIMDGICYDNYISRLINGIVNIGVNSTLEMPENYSLNLTGTPMGSPQLNMAAGSKLRLGGDKSLPDAFGSSYGVAGSNFPNKLVCSFNASSTVEYYGRSGITQTIYNGPIYANLTASNGPGTGRAPKITTGSLNVNGVTNINALTDLTLGGDFSSGGNCNVLSTGGLYCKAWVVSGAGAFTLNNLGFLGMGHANGIFNGSTANGNIQMMGGRTFSLSGNYIYNGTVNQTTGPGLPTTCNDLTIDNTASGGTVTISNSQLINGNHYLTTGTFQIGTNKITVAGNGTIVRNAGFMKANLGILDMAGTSGTAQALSGTWFTGKTISTLVNSNTKGITLSSTANDSLLIASALLTSPSITNSTITTNGNLTLLSRDTATARVGEMIAGSRDTIVGKVNVERYVLNKRKWRHMAIPTISNQTARQSWMEGSISANDNLNPGYGTIVTDERATWAAGGFDSRSLSGPSVKYFSPTLGALGDYVNLPTATGYVLSTQNSYMNFIRGDRLSTPANPLLSPTILRTSGTLRQQNVADTVPAGKYYSAGNPYACPIDLRKIDTIGLTGFIYVWDPKLAGIYGVGGYQTLSVSGGHYTASPGGGSYGFAGSAIDTIESGQAFFVKARTGVTGYVTFKESSKTGSARVMSRGGENTGADYVPGDEEKMYALLSLVDPTDTILADGALAAFNPMYDNDVTDDDALKLPNTGENISFKRNGTLLAVEHRLNIQTDDTLFLNMSGMRTHKYKWDLVLQNLDAPGRVAFLVDSYLNTSTLLDLTGTQSIYFDVFSGANAANRFKIVFMQELVVPVRFTSISAERNNDKSISVKWHGENEINMADYKVERSADGHAFAAIGTQLPANNSGGAVSYSFVDRNAAADVNYYRVKGYSTNGRVDVSAIVKVGPLKQRTGISVYPNPIVENTLHLQFTDELKGKYSIQIFDKAGRLVKAESLQLQNGSSVESVALGKIAKGSYSVRIIDPNNEIHNINFIVQ